MSTSAKALFIGLTYIDVTIPTDNIPQGDDKAIAQTYNVGIGGNATIAAITHQKLRGETLLITPLAKDFLGQLVEKKYADYGIQVFSRDVEKSSLSLVMPNNDKRAILRCQDKNYLTPFPETPLDGVEALHLDGHQPDAALHYAQVCREMGILTSLDGGGLKDGILELLTHIDVAVLSLKFCKELEKTPEQTLAWLWQTYQTPVAAVTLGENGVLYQLRGGATMHLPSLTIAPEKITDTTGAGDIFHGAYVASYLNNKEQTWAEHFRYARAASTFSIQKLGTEASIPTPNELNAYL
mgnify:CR=1 FL=1